MNASLLRASILATSMLYPAAGYCITPPPGCSYDASACTVKATGSTTARSSAARAADVINVRDYGAKCDSTTNDTTAFAAAAAAIPSTGGVLYIPAGTCLVKATTLLKSNTAVRGDGWGSIVLTDSTFTPGLGSGNNSIFENVNYSASVLTDSNIIIEDLQLDYGTFGPVVVPNSKKQVTLEKVSNVIIRNVLFQTRGGGDALAAQRVYNMLVTGNSAYDFTNAAYDFWDASTNVRLVGNYAETASSAQIINFNPDATSGTTVGATASGFLVTGNHFVTNAGNATPSQIEPIGATASINVRDVTISANIFDNCTLYIRGNTADVVITGNTFNSTRGGAGNINAYTQNGATPNNLVISSNIFRDPDTNVGNLGVIRSDGATTVASITHNHITGSGYVTGIYTATAPAIVVGNYVSNGVNSTASSTQNYGKFGISGITSGLIKINPQAAAGSYEFDLPTTAGTAGQVLTSQAGGGTAMTWTTPVMQTVANSLTATGTVQGDAFALTAGTNVFTTVGAGTGALLLSTNLYVQRIVNFGANALLVYPPSGASIGSHASNVAFSLAALSVATCIYSNSIHWYCTSTALS
jgi:hypothetical protein